MPDRLRVRDISLQLVIGVFESERVEPQEVRLDYTIEADLEPAGHSDALDDAPDYHALTNRLIECAQASRFRLLEALAQKLADETLAFDKRIAAVDIRLRKPAALENGSVEIEIRRSRSVS